MDFQVISQPIVVDEVTCLKYQQVDSQIIKSIEVAIRWQQSCIWALITYSCVNW